MCNENSRFNRARVISCPQRKEAQKEMMKKLSEVREEILQLNPMTSLYWDQNLKIWIFIVATSQKLHLPDYNWTFNKSGSLPDAEEFADLKGLKKLILNSAVIGYVMSCKNL